MHLYLPLLFFLITTATGAALPDKSPREHSARRNPATSTTSKKSSGRKSTTTAANSKDDRKEQQKHQPKYFHEAGGSLELGHYDARFFQGKVPYAEHGPALRRLVRSWLATADALGIEDAWLAHGTLLGWWWNGRVMPWDYDLDVQMPVATLSYLGRYFNGTLYDYRFGVEEGEGEGGGVNGTGVEGRGVYNGGDDNRSKGNGSSYRGDTALNGLYVNKTYLLDVNPHHTDLDRGNGANVIDARWIDVSNGLFVDITGLAERDPAGSPGVWSCKNAHRYRTTELFPVRHTEFEGVPARVPYAFDKILVDEYGSKSLTATEWADHRWIQELKEWVKIPESLEDEDGDKSTSNKQHEGGNSVVVVVEKTVVKGSQ